MGVTPNKNCAIFAMAALMHAVLQFLDTLAWIKIGIRKNKYQNRLRISEFILLEYSYWQELCISVCLANTYRFFSFSFFFSIFVHFVWVFSWITFSSSYKHYQTCTVKDQEETEQVKVKRGEKKILSFLCSWQGPLNSRTKLFCSVWEE